MPPTDRLQAARQTYAEIAEASRSLGEKAAALEKAVTTTAESVAAMRREVAQLHTDLDRGRDRVARHGAPGLGGRRRTQEGDTAAVDVDVRDRHRRRVRGYVPLALGPLGGGGSLGGASPVGGGSHARTAARASRNRGVEPEATGQLGATMTLP